MHQNGKIVLPTTDLCRFRRDVSHMADGEQAVCGLIEGLIPGADAELCRVHRSVCDACCRTFPPSSDLLNPVVASVMYDIANQVLAEGGDCQAGAEPIRQIKLLAERALDTICTQETSLIPGLLLAAR
jgi:hypothetical protein